MLINPVNPVNNDDTSVSGVEEHVVGEVEGANENEFAGDEDESGAGYDTFGNSTAVIAGEGGGGVIVLVLLCFNCAKAASISAASRAFSASM